MEIGAYLGRSTSYIASAVARRQNVNFYTVDTWQNQGMSEGERDTYGEFCANVQPWKDYIQTFRGFSWEVVKQWNRPIDLLWIDADHSYVAARRDVLDWVPFLKVKGWLCLDDYATAAGIAQVVRDVLLPICSSRRLVGKMWAARLARPLDRGGHPALRR
ncbi:MAG: class I SAM-dependent methyltransferase [Chloroflexi bacterium]|nr:class I SAM-dependent methyltransferase [Chloroflexota bacterium]